MTTYTPARLQELHREDFGMWTGREVVVRDARGVELARGVLKGFTYQSRLGLRMDGSTVGKPGSLLYSFTSGGPLDGTDDLICEPSHTVEVEDVPDTTLAPLVVTSEPPPVLPIYSERTTCAPPPPR